KFNAEDTQRMLGNAASNMSAEYHAGAGIFPHRAVVTKWLHQMVNSNFEDAEKVAAWALDYTLKQSNTPAEVEPIFQALIDLLTLCIDVGSPPSRTKTKSPSVSLISLPTNLKLFSAGSKNEALVALEDWIVANINSYMKIYDPYFTADNLSILKSVPTDVQVYVITSWKAQSGVSVGDRVIEKLFKDAWSRMSDSNPPWTQIVIVGTRSGDSPIHNRYILTEGKGLNLGTSIGGLGNKDSDLRVLDKSETDLIASKFVDPLLGPQLYPYKTERLVVHSFVL
ncbi:MAG: hypothetical protein OEV08_05795, partial [Nitrospira sp.]|nr:hypothetical protein [Nitrospira sp.]